MNYVYRKLNENDLTYFDKLSSFRKHSLKVGKYLLSNDIADILLIPLFRRLPWDSRTNAEKGSSEGRPYYFGIYHGVFFGLETELEYFNKMDSSYSVRVMNPVKYIVKKDMDVVNNQIIATIFDSYLRTSFLSNDRNDMKYKSIDTIVFDDFNTLFINDYNEL